MDYIVANRRITPSALCTPANPDDGDTPNTDNHRGRAKYKDEGQPVYLSGFVGEVYLLDHNKRQVCCASIYSTWYFVSCIICGCRHRNALFND